VMVTLTSVLLCTTEEVLHNKYYYFVRVYTLSGWRVYTVLLLLTHNSHTLKQLPLSL